MTSAPYLIITALPEEREGIAKYLPGLQVHSGDGTGDARVYYQARLNLPGKPLVVVTTIGRPGRVSAATAATVAIKRWCPDVVLLVGIAGGLSKKNVRLGDVIVASHIFDYEHQRLRDGRAPEIHTNVWQADPNLHRAATDRGSGRWPGSILLHPPDGRIPGCRQGTVASGDKFVADEKFLATIDTDQARLLGVEMEGAGVACACAESEHRPRFLMIRAVSDHPDARTGNRGDAAARATWRTYACHSAGLFAVDVIHSFEKSPGRSQGNRVPVSLRNGKDTGACILGLSPRKTTCCRCHDVSGDVHLHWPNLPNLLRGVAMLCRIRAVLAAVSAIACLVTVGQRLLPNPLVSGTLPLLFLLGIGCVPAIFSIGYMMKVADGLALKSQVFDDKASPADVDNFLAIVDRLAFPATLLPRAIRRTE